MASSTPILSERPTWRRRALTLMVALSLLLVVGMLAASCGGSTGGGRGRSNYDRYRPNSDPRDGTQHYREHGGAARK